jgi:GxxExxY protein
VSDIIIGSAMRVHNELGVGFLEKVYENALAHEFRKLGYVVQQQHPVNVYYDQTIVGQYNADLLVENSVIVEVKAVESHHDAHLAQCLNYLRASGMTLGLVLNFGKPRLGIKRVVHNF